MRKGYSMCRGRGIGRSQGHAQGPHESQTERRAVSARRSMHMLATRCSPVLWNHSTRAVSCKPQKRGVAGCLRPHCPRKGLAMPAVVFWQGVPVVLLPRIEKLGRCEPRGRVAPPQRELARQQLVVAPVGLVGDAVHARPRIPPRTRGASASACVRARTRKDVCKK